MSTSITIINILDKRAKDRSNCIAYRYLQDGKEIELTYGELKHESLAIANKLSTKNLQGERVLLIYPHGLEFIKAFFGCLYAGVIAVPVYPPRNNRRLFRLETIVKDAEARGILTIVSLEEKIKKYSNFNNLELICSDRTEGIEGSDRDFKINNDIAFLQYTSGSTGSPKGVIITHKNIIENSKLIYESFGHSDSSVGVSWLPLYHDMGLIGGVLQPLYGGFPVTLFSPTDLLRKPLFWLQSISELKATTSGAPDFAYQLCLDKIKEEDKTNLDLSNWNLAFIGAEPIRVKTLDKFSKAFAECGFRKSAFYPCYGMAESTLMISGGIKGELLNDLIRVYNHKKGLHIVVMYLVIGNWKFPWSFRVYRGKGTPSPSQLAQKLLNNLPSILTKSFQIYVLGDTAFGTIKLINKIYKSLKFHAIVGISKSRNLQDRRKVSELKTKGQQVYLKGLNIPVFLSWVWLKRDGKRIQRFVVSTKPMKGKTIARWGKKRWQIEGFFTRG